jgi:N-acyl-D-aspartate/D-glutamate deacylase
VLDLVVRNGFVTDGSGSPGFQGDVGVRGGRIVAMGRIDEPARSVIDAEGKVVAPGFVDLHTHYDAQLFYDPGLSPSPLHGVTSVVAGNCGLTLAPAAPEDRSFLTRLLARVESIPVGSVEAGVQFVWQSYGEFLDTVSRRELAANIGFMVGHSAVRRAVMGEAASKGPATPEQLERMCRLLSECIAAGGMGFSTANVVTQVDGDGRPTPPNFASRQELVALAGVCGEHPGTSIEFIPDSFLRGFSDEDIELMADMSAAADRPLNWNTLLINQKVPELHLRQLRAGEVARRRGGRIVPFFTPHNLELQHDFEPGYVFRAVPGWAWLFDLDTDKRIAALGDADRRRELERSAAEPTSGLAVVVRNWSSYRVNDVGPAEQAELEGRRVADLAEEWRLSPFEAMAEVAVRCRLQVGFVRSQYDPADSWAWNERLRLLKHPEVVLQASDAGAHLDMMTGADFPVRCLAELVRERQAFTVEEMVHQLSDVPARLYGLKDRGRLDEGAHADIVVFDPGAVGATPLRTVHDLPGGAARLVTSSTGIDRVLVSGREVVREGEYTGERPGGVLRSGRDTVTVAAR